MNEMVADEPREQAWKALTNALELCRMARPGDRSMTDRAYAVVITDLERVEAYFDYWINNNHFDKEVP